MTAAILHFPGPGPVFGGQAFQDNALALARAVYAADVPNEVFWLTVSALMESPYEDDRAKGNAVYDARLKAQYMADPVPETTSAPGLVPGWLLSAGVFCCIASMMVGGYALQGLGVL